MQTGLWRMVVQLDLRAVYMFGGASVLLDQAGKGALVGILSFPLVGCDGGLLPARLFPVIR